jgi:multiple sugar transport system substrate-binding protein
MADKPIMESIQRAMSRRDFMRVAGGGAVAFGALGATGLLEACLGSPSTSSAGASGTISIVHEGSADLIAIIKGVLAEFEKQHPNIHVNSQVIPGGGTTGNWAQYSDALVTQIAGGQVPDVVWMATEGLRVFASQGLLEPLNSYITRDKQELSDYFANVPQNVFTKWDKLESPNGTQYELPSQFNTVCMWYSKPMFQQAGLPEPSPDWTWDDFHAAAKKIAVGGKYAMHVNQYQFAGILPWLFTNGASTLDSTWSKATIDSPQAIEAAKFMRSLITEGLAPRLGGQFDPFASMAQGKLAMFAAGWWPLPTIKQLGVLDKVGIVPFPKNAQKGSPVGWNMYPIFKASKNKEAAWTFIKFMTSKSTNKYISERGVTLPLAKSSAFSGPIDQGPAGAHYVYDALDYATPVPSPDKNAVIQQQIENTFSDILAGNADPASALRQLNSKIQSNL